MILYEQEVLYILRIGYRIASVKLIISKRPYIADTSGLMREWDTRLNVSQVHVGLRKSLFAAVNCNSNQSKFCR